MNVAYKHLDGRLRIAELTFAQWFGVAFGVGLAIVWNQVSPLGVYVTLASAAYLAAIPVGLSLVAGAREVDVVLLVRSAIAWKRRDGRYLPGPGRSAHGYVVHAPGPHDLDDRRTQRILDPVTLWDS